VRRAARPFRPARRTRASPRSSRPSTAGRGQGQRGQLGTLVLHTGTALRDRRDVARVAAGQDHRVRGEPAGLTAAADQLVDGRKSGPGDQRHPGRHVVGVQQGGELGEVVDGHAGVHDERILHGLDHPARMAARDAEVPERIDRRVRGDGRDPVGELTTADLAQHGVDEPGRAALHPRARERDGLADGRVRRNAHVQELVAAEP